jgi:hypothetical protein
MRKKTIKKSIILFVGFFVTAASILPSISGQSSGIQSDYVTNTDNVAIAVQTRDDITTLHYTLDTFSMTPVMIDNKQYMSITIDNEPKNLIAGTPDLPSISRSIIIPNDAIMTIRVIAATYEEYKNVFITPSKGNLPRTVNPAVVPYEFSDIYSQNIWYPTSIAELQEPYYLRDFHGQVVTIHPFQYNPDKATLRFYSDITVEISPTTLIAKSSATQQTLTKIDKDFLPTYQHHFINFNRAIYTPVSEQGNMLVITYNNFYTTMIPFVQWKNQKGIPTEIVNVSTIGNANAIKSYIADYYNAHGLTFVLLVGDAGQVPTYYQDGYVASDPSYGYIVGNDHYPDLFVGRFSAETIAQVQTQVNRVITYERNPQTTAGWYKKGIGIGSEYGIGDDNEYDYEHIRNIRALLMNFTYISVDEFYGGSQGGGDAPGEPTPTMISTALNEGRSIINYCGHGSMTSWGTSGFSNSNVNALTNDNKLPFVFSVACYNGAFDSGTCFAEAWLRATHNGQPIGAIGAYMSTISQSWDPPMEAQDEFNNILVGLYQDNKKTTFGALCYSGAMSMNDDYGSDGENETDAWTVFGDPSVQVRTDTPSAMTVTHDSSIPYASDAFDVTVSGVSGALCALSYQYNLLGYGYTDEMGHATIQLFAPLHTNGSVQLVFTSFNTIPYMNNITVGPPNYTPKIPTITGPTKGLVNINYTFSVVTTDPENDSLFYYIDWGDGTNSSWFGPYPSGTQISVIHQWNLLGTFLVRAKAKDAYHFGNDWSDPLNITINVNQPPNTPTITGTERGKPGKVYPYNFQTVDPDDDNVYYFIDWGDNTSSEWLGPYSSNVEVSANHSWSQKGAYIIKIKAKDTKGSESNWGLLSIKMPLSIPISIRFVDFLEQLFPRLFQLFNILLQT